MKGLEPVYRIAVRNEGAWINAYIAQMGTMDDAIKIASLLKSAADQDREIFEAWLKFLQAQVDRLFERVVGTRATRFMRHEPDTLRPYTRSPTPSPTPEPDTYRSALAEPWPSFVLTPEPAPQPEFKSGGGGDYAGAGASGSWDAPPAVSAAAYDAPSPPPPPEPPPPPPPEPPPPPPPSD